ncbi:methyltransferase domain protein [Oxobacter pfennigii]|uniref:Methyltransferase domain protein n=1 Tax=Oxobacter pfennigii TaxID=36849 RepID=A0A0P9ABT0_9CLOT|nr:methyltransferase domain-containing protein [Oxobacter pfennigii]KPU42538.1 methyltransferase domain protein [Oxobacter pfennigii]
MLFSWNEDTIRWYRAAEEYAGFFKNVADAIRGRLKGCTTLSDMGCGLGLVDLELCKYIEKITCIDTNKNAIGQLNKNIHERKITNIATRVMDCFDADEKWDVIYASFFGGKNLVSLLPKCKMLIAVVNGEGNEELYPVKKVHHQKTTINEVEEMMKKKGIQYNLTKTAFEFGQPFISMEDARKFVMNLAPETSPEMLERFLFDRLIKINNEKCPLYMPRMKSIGIFEIKGGA